MGWHCEACGHAPHGSNHGRGCMRQAEGQAPCGCTHVTDREEYRRGVMDAHAAPERNTDYQRNVNEQRSGEWDD